MGSLMLMFSLNIDWTANYVIKLAGFLFLLVGSAQIRASLDNQPESKIAYENIGKEASVCSGFTLVAIMCVLLTKFVLKPSLLVGNVVYIIIGIAVTYMALNLYRKLVANLISDGENPLFVDNKANIKRLGKSYKRLAFTIAVNVLFDVVQRIVPISIVDGTAGAIVAVTRILGYILLVILCVQFYKIRTDFNKKHVE